MLGGARWSGRRAVWLGAMLGAVIVVASAIPRLDNTPLWLDEAYSLGAANQLREAVSATGGTMVLYYGLLSLWVKVSSATPWLRTMSVVWAVLTMPVFASLARRIGGRRLAILAPVLLALNPEFGLKAAEARSYSLEIFLTVTGTLAIVAAVQAGVTSRAARRWWLLLALVAPLGLLAQGFFVLVLVAWALILLLSPRPGAAVLRALPAVVTSGLAAGWLYALGLSDIGGWIPPTSPGVIWKLVKYFTSPNVLVLAATLALLGWGSTSDVRRWWRARRQGAAAGRPHEATLDAPPAHDEAVRELGRAWAAMSCTIWAVVPPLALLAVSVVKHSFNDRYVATAVPGLVLVFAGALCRVFDRLRKRVTVVGNRREVAFGLLLVVSVAVLWPASQPGLRDAHDEDWRVVAEKIATEAQPGDGIVLASDLVRPPFEAAWNEVDHPVVPGVANMPRQLGEVRRIDDYDSLLYEDRRKLEKYSRIWLITRDPKDWAPLVYTRRPPLSDLYTLVEQKSYVTVSGPLVLRLYVRKVPVANP